MSRAVRHATSAELNGQAVLFQDLRLHSLAGTKRTRLTQCDFVPLLRSAAVILCAVLFSSVEPATGQAPIDGSADAASLVTDPAVVAERGRFFENKIRPLLVENCIKCHGPEKQQGNLRLDSLDGLTQGGDSGPSIVIGQSDKSLLVSAVRHEDFEMPPNKRLPDEQIEALILWIDHGAHWPVQSAAKMETRRGKILSDEDRNYWAVQPLARVEVPDVRSAIDGDRCENELDAFIIAAHSKKGLSLAPPAEPLVLARRVYFDLLGVPPTPAEIDQYKSDTSDQAYEHLVDRLLDDPRYGQRWGRHWLDLVRYAESDGFKQDAYRPTAYLYRDYVINALNRDMPYDQFVFEQLAGDEAPNADSSTLAATGFLRHWIYEYNQRDVRTQWSNILNDLTDVTGEVFLGLGIGCARCHDHKFDPILQKDYYRLQASFAAFLPRDNALAAAADELDRYHAQLGEWEAATATIRAEMNELEREVRERTAAKAIDKFPPDVRPLLRRSNDERSPFEMQIADLALRQVSVEWEKLDYGKQLKGEQKERWQALKEELDKFTHLKPAAPDALLAAGETGVQAPPTFIPASGSSSQAEPIIPATFEVLGATPLIAVPPAGAKSTGRRTALANWINDAANPLTHRVIVNRVWQYHFGTGIVANASDFGRLGEPPSHPEMLDWLANWWLENGRSFKRLHKLIVQSATYRQASRHPDGERYADVDHRNMWLWHFPARRLDAEQVRDAMLVASGTIDWKMGGPASEHGSNRRAIYTKVMRNTPDPMLNVLDAPDGSSSVARRSVTTTAVQSLLLANSPWPIELSREMAANLRSEQSSTEEQIILAYRRCFARKPSPEEMRLALKFLDDQAQVPIDSKETDGSQESSEENDSGRPGAHDEPPNAYGRALADLCHVLLNSSEFLYVD